MKLLVENIAFSTAVLILLINLIGYVYSYLIVSSKIGNAKQIQPNYKISFDYFKKHTPLFFFNVLTLIVFVYIGLYFENIRIYVIDVDSEFSTISIIIHLFIILVFDDTFFYFLHRLMHENKYIYTKVHKIHHRANSPIPMDYIYVHPLEWMSGFIGPFIGILLLGGVSIYTFWLYLFVRNLHELSIHSGLKTSFIYKILPFYGTNEHHDVHHSKRDGNYSSTFTFWDNVFKTKF